MAKVTLTKSHIKNSLNDLLEKLNAAIAWADRNYGKAPTLEIPEPFDHPVVYHQPANTSPPCLMVSAFEDCSDIGILMGVLKAMSKPGKEASTVQAIPEPGKKVSSVKAKPKPRK